MKNYRILTAGLAAILVMLPGCGQAPAGDGVSSGAVSGVQSPALSSQEDSKQAASLKEDEALIDSASSEISGEAGMETVSDLQNGLIKSVPKTAQAQSKTEPQLILSSEKIALGEVLVLTLQNPPDENIQASTNFGFTPRFFSVKEANSNLYQALVPIHYNLTPGNYEITVKAGSYTLHKTVALEDRDFIVQHLTMDEGVASSTNTAEANAQWEREIEPLKLVSDPEKYWDGAFIQPVTGTITTEYGCIRYTNGSTVASRHSGLDIAAKTGTPVPAAGAGRVQFAGYLLLTGNTVVIEHGHGLKSLYYHMDSVNVNTGDMVTQGQQIGAVGSTGYSTGPHLHFSMTVNNVFVNPWTMFEKELI